MAGTVGNPIDLTWQVTDLIDLAAQADMAWRRGGWLIMLRARAQKVPVAGDAGVAETHPVKRLYTGTGAGGGSACDQGVNLAALVEALVELGVEDVFRNVVTFL